MHGGNKQVYHKILIPYFASTGAMSATFLGPVFAKHGPFDISHVRNCNHHTVVSNGIFNPEILRCIFYLGFWFITIFFFDFEKLGFNDFHTESLIGEYAFVVFDHAAEFIKFSLQFITFQSGKRLKPHSQDGF